MDGGEPVLPIGKHIPRLHGKIAVIGNGRQSLCRILLRQNGKQIPGKALCGKAVIGISPAERAVRPGHMGKILFPDENFCVLPTNLRGKAGVVGVKMGEEDVGMLHGDAELL